MACPPAPQSTRYRRRTHHPHHRTPRFDQPYTGPGKSGQPRTAAHPSQAPHHQPRRGRADNRSLSPPDVAIRRTPPAPPEQGDSYAPLLKVKTTIRGSGSECNNYRRSASLEIEFVAIVVVTPDKAHLSEAAISKCEKFCAHDENTHRRAPRGEQNAYRPRWDTPCRSHFVCG